MKEGMAVSDSHSMPKILDNTKVCVVCEGGEEYDYLSRLTELNLWDAHYSVNLFDAKGNGNIAAIYQDKFQSGSYDMVLIFCDTEKKPYKQFEDIRQKVNELHGNDEAADWVIIYGNPCTLQIVILHWGMERMTKAWKKINAPLVEKYTGIAGYKAKGQQRIELMEKVEAGNIPNMLDNISRLPDDYKEIGSTNFGRLVKWLQSDNDQWIQDFMTRMDEVE